LWLGSAPGSGAGFGGSPKQDLLGQRRKLAAAGLPPAPEPGALPGINAWLNFLGFEILPFAL